MINKAFFARVKDRSEKPGVKQSLVLVLKKRPTEALFITLETGLLNEDL
jgi:hypothetical protein